MNILFIDYKDLINYNTIEASQRLLFLKTILNIVENRFLTYKNLGFSKKELSIFLKILDSPNLRKHFLAIDEGVQLNDEIDGKLIVNFDPLMDDISLVLATEKSTVRQIIEKLKEGDIDSYELEDYFGILAPLIFGKWLFKEIDVPLIPHSIEGLETYKENLKNIDIYNLKEIFDLNYFTHEIDKLFLRKNDGELSLNDIINIKNFILDITRFLENLHPETFGDKLFNIRYYAIDVFNKNKEKKTDLKIKDYENKYIFLVMEGNIKKNPRNPIISNFDGKIVLFNDANSLVNELKVGDVVIGEIIVEKANFIGVMPIQRVNKKMVLSYIRKGVLCMPSKLAVMRSLESK